MSTMLLCPQSCSSTAWTPSARTQQLQGPMKLARSQNIFVSTENGATEAFGQRPENAVLSTSRARWSSFYSFARIR